MVSELVHPVIDVARNSGEVEPDEELEVGGPLDGGFVTRLKRVGYVARCHRRCSELVRPWKG